MEPITRRQAEWEELILEKKGMDYDLTEAESPWAGVGDTGRFP